MLRWLTALSLIVAPGMLHADAQEPRLHFADDARAVGVVSLGLAALLERCGERRVEVEDPYYKRPMAFRAVPLGCAMRAGFNTPMEALARDDFLLIALDGYKRPSSGAQLAEPGGHLAFADANLAPEGSAPRFAPITRRQLDPAPFYLVWSEPGQDDTHRYPWPFQLATIERAPFERRHPHTIPTGAPDGSPARRGFALFRSQCVMCHSINGEGGTVGPELNVPRSIVEYRPIEQLKAFIRDPQQFRYSAMPAHRHLGDSELDALIAYFRAMSRRKHDPHAASEP